MWHLKTITLPVVIGALGIMAKTAPNSKNNTHGHRTYPAKSTVNVIYIYMLYI